MYHPQISYTRRGIPVMSRAQMDVIAERFLEDFNPEYLKEPCEIDIEQFAMEYLGLRQDFQYLSKQGIYLGMIVFFDTDFVEVYDEEKDEAKYVSEKAGTIIIDRSLLEAGQEGRLRFTMGHEVAHSIFHRPPKKDPYDESIELFYGAERGDSQTGMFRCNLDDRDFVSEKDEKWSDYQWKEWQADAFSSSILMPVSMVRRVAEDCSMPLNHFAGWSDCIERITYTFNVSRKAAEVRLAGLGIIRPREEQVQPGARGEKNDTTVRINPAGIGSRLDILERYSESLNPKQMMEDERILNQRDMDLWGYTDTGRKKSRSRRKKS